ncbi:MAG: DUF4956 domain-containing protein [Bacteroidetes bacterium]|nr:MAG: DUF4956 domain-containing protein [Bacteroidota bacterium]
MIEDFQTLFVFTITAKDVIANILVAMTCGFLIAFLYKYTYSGLNYSAAFTVSLIMLTMITAVVIMVIGNNLARAFGMVGAMSIIRFRTAVKDASDIMFIFFALTIGLASGVKLYSIAFLGTFFIGFVYFVISKMNFALPKKREFLMQIVAREEELEENPFNEVLRKFCSRHKLVNVKSMGEEKQLMEFSYYVHLKDENKGGSMVSELKSVGGVEQTNLFFDETS